MGDERSNEGKRARDPLFRRQIHHGRERHMLFWGAPQIRLRSAAAAVAVLDTAVPLLLPPPIPVTTTRTPFFVRHPIKR